MNNSQFFMIDLPCSEAGHPDGFKLSLLSENVAWTAINPSAQPFTASHTHTFDM
jgi:hypothetical protein